MCETKGDSISPARANTRSNDDRPIINEVKDSHEKLHRDIFPLGDHVSFHLLEA